MSDALLHNLPRGAWFVIVGSEQLGPFKLERLDGAYSRCFDVEGRLHHFAVWTPVVAAEAA